MASIAAGSCIFPFNSKTNRLKRTVFPSPNFTVRSIASPQRHRPPPVAPTPEIDPSGHRNNHVAWTSIRQEKWEGELSVQGQLPYWLVRIIGNSLVFLLFLFLALSVNLVIRCQNIFHRQIPHQ